jgi:L-amino acid N-acyltransferase YncA
MASPFILDILTPSDWEQVREIYLQGIATGLATFETEAPPWERWNAAHHPFARLGARAGAQLWGWAALAPVSSRAVYRGVAEVSLYVRDSARGKGVGRALMEELIAVSEANGIWTLQASIFAFNQPSLALHRAGGFREVGRRERIGQLRGEWMDTILMERRSSKF